MNLVRKYWNVVSQCGVSKNNSLELNKRITIANQSAIILFLAFLASCITDFFAGIYCTVIITLPLTIWMPLLPWINSKGKYEMGLKITVIAICFYLFLSDAYLGESAANYIFYFPAIVATSFLADINKRKQYYFLVFIPLFFLVLSIITDHSLLLDKNITAKQLEMNRITNLLNCIFITVGYVYIIKSINFKAEVSLVHQKNFLDQIFNNSADAMFLVDFETDLIIDCNEMAMKYYEVDHRSELIGTHGYLLQKDLVKPQVISERKLSIKQGEKYSHQVLYLSKKGREFWGDVAVTYFEIEEKAYMLVRVTDVTTQKLAEAEAKAVTIAKDHFLSSVSHEIRTPLNSVIGMSYLLLQDETRSEQKEKLNILKFSAEHLLGLLNNILDFSKIDNQKIIFETENVDLRQLVSNIKNLNQQEAEKRNTSVKTLIDDDVPNYILGDPIRLGQILNNLVSNAVKFTANGRVTIELMVSNKTDKDISIDFSVTDTGIGIAQDNQERIFDMFSQARTDTTRKFGGTGLGLAITKRLLQLMNSEIKVSSTLGLGSKFYFTLTLPMSDKTNSLLNPVVMLENENLLKGRKILLVEDSNFNIIVAKRFLEMSQVEVDVAETGFEGVKKAKENKYDLVLMDLQLPDIDGYEAAKEIRRFNTQIPIVALTAMVQTDISQKLYDFGMNDYILKPFNPDSLKIKIARNLKNLNIKAA